jgi:hypothetical protein
MLNTFLNFIRILPTSKWWSDAVSAHLLTQTSWSDLLFQTKQSRIKANLIQCYAPTNDAEDSDKDNVYNTRKWWSDAASAPLLT